MKCPYCKAEANGDICPKCRAELPKKIEHKKKNENKEENQNGI
jgi:predicted amidophosphoribosyltransferase